MVTDSFPDFHEQWSLKTSLKNYTLAHAIYGRKRKQ